jgi:hypothetical protein
MRCISRITLLVAAVVCAPLSAVWGDVFHMPPGQTSLQAVPVGNPGNANDPADGFGGISYSFSKAAYFDPKVGHYWRSAMGTDTLPTSTPPGSTPDTSNFYGISTGYAVTASTSYSLSQNYLTDVGAYLASPSPYGTFDQSGDVLQWTEGLTPSGRVSRESWWDYHNSGDSSTRTESGPLFQGAILGFRVATRDYPGDVNLDGLVSVADVSAMMDALANPSAYQQMHGLMPGELTAIGDLNSDNQVTNVDLQGLINMLANNATGGSSISAVPEPSAFALMIVALGIFLGFCAKAGPCRTFK